MSSALEIFSVWPVVEPGVNGLGLQGELSHSEAHWLGVMLSRDAGDGVRLKITCWLVLWGAVVWVVWLSGWVWWVAEIHLHIVLIIYFLIVHSIKHSYLMLKFKVWFPVCHSHMPVWLPLVHSKLLLSWSVGCWSSLLDGLCLGLGLCSFLGGLRFLWASLQRHWKVLGGSIEPIHVFVGQTIWKP